MKFDLGDILSAIKDFNWLELYRELVTHGLTKKFEVATLPLILMFVTGITLGAGKVLSGLILGTATWFMFFRNMEVVSSREKQMIPESAKDVERALWDDEVDLHTKDSDETIK